MKKATIWKLNTIAAAIISGATMMPVMAVAQDGMVAIPKTK
jgi:hypothetical protein